MKVSDGYAYAEPETLEIIVGAMMDRLVQGDGGWQDSPIYYDGIGVQACDCGERISLVVHSLEFMDDQCGRDCLGVSRITDSAPTTWLPSGFAHGTPPSSTTRKTMRLRTVAF